MNQVGTPQLWALFAAFVAVALLIDFLALRKQGAHRVALAEAGLWSLLWVGASAAFVGWLWWTLGGLAGNPLANTKATEFITGYVIEKALAVDNIFVFLLVINYFAVPPEFQKRVLMIGILGALVLRAAMILIGAWLVTQFHWVLYLFGAFLVYTGYQMWRAAGEEPDLEANSALQWMRRKMKIAAHFDGEKLFTVVAGVPMATPLLAVVLLISVVDIVFAVDSIPAIFAITTDPFIVLTSNACAILGLRALYFLLAGLHEKFHLLSYGLSLVLAFIGAKMLLADLVPISVAWSLAVTFAILAATIVLSLRIAPKGAATTGAYPFPAKKSADAGDGGAGGGDRGAR